MQPVPGRQWIDIAGAVLCVVALPFAVFRVFTDDLVTGQVSGGLLMLMAGYLGLTAGLRIRARVRARRQTAAEDRVEP